MYEPFRSRLKHRVVKLSQRRAAEIGLLVQNDLESPGQRALDRSAAEFYAATFPGSRVERVNVAPADFPGGQGGTELTVEFTVLGQRFVGLNGGPNFRLNEAVSFMIVTENQEETDRYWDAIVGNGGAESACGWCRDRWGFSWQIRPRRLLDLTTSPDRDAAKAFQAMMTMHKICIAGLDAAVAEGGA